VQAKAQEAATIPGLPRENLRESVDGLLREGVPSGRCESMRINLKDAPTGTLGSLNSSGCYDWTLWIPGRDTLHLDGGRDWHPNVSCEAFAGQNP